MRPLRIALPSAVKAILVLKKALAKLASLA
jgi:hypothetical protein